MDEWIESHHALALVATIDRSFAAQAICGRAFDGLVAARARRYIRGHVVADDCQVPTEFWWARGGSALSQNWASGDFETWLDRNSDTWCRAYGVTFRRKDIDAILPKAVGRAATAAGAEASAASSGSGRRLSELWPDWVAEMVAHVHEHGYPAGAGAQGQDELIKTIADRLARRGRAAPSRTTVQPAVHAVLSRLREIG
jgi:hypothetical protein